MVLSKQVHRPKFKILQEKKKQFNLTSKAKVVTKWQEISKLALKMDLMTRNLC